MSYDQNDIIVIATGYPEKNKVVDVVEKKKKVVEVVDEKNKVVDVVDEKKNVVVVEEKNKVVHDKEETYFLGTVVLVPSLDLEEVRLWIGNWSCLCIPTECTDDHEDDMVVLETVTQVMTFSEFRGKIDRLISLRTKMTNAEKWTYRCFIVPESAWTIIKQLEDDIGEFDTIYKSTPLDLWPSRDQKQAKPTKMIVDKKKKKMKRIEMKVEYHERAITSIYQFLNEIYPYCKHSFEQGFANTIKPKEERPYLPPEERNFPSSSYSSCFNSWWIPFVAGAFGGAVVVAICSKIIR